jgi:hypothetical protein
MGPRAGVVEAFTVVIENHLGVIEANSKAMVAQPGEVELGDIGLRINLEALALSEVQDFRIFDC